MNGCQCDYITGDFSDAIGISVGNLSPYVTFERHYDRNTSDHHVPECRRMMNDKKTNDEKYPRV